MKFIFLVITMIVQMTATIINTTVKEFVEQKTTVEQCINESVLTNCIESEWNNNQKS